MEAAPAHIGLNHDDTLGQAGLRAVSFHKLLRNRCTTERKFGEQGAAAGEDLLRQFLVLTRRDGL